VSRRGTALLGAGLAGSLLLSGCSFRGAADFPLPGGAGGGGYEVKVEFEDVLDLVPQSAVKVNDVTVGSVREIELGKDGYTAVVTIQVEKDVELPENATAQLRQTSLLGEKFVALEEPADPVGRLKDGAYIELERTDRNVDIEEVLGALSLVLNGGSLEQLQVINSELTKALAGRETQVKDFLRQLSGFVGGLDQQKAKIVDALDAIDRLTVRLAARTDTLDVALRDLPKGAAVLADEREQLTRVLKGLQDLGSVATRVIRATQQSTIADLEALRPILGSLADAGQDLPNALELLTTYPFPRTVAGPQGKGGIRGDYANLYVTIDTDLNDLLDNLLGRDNNPLPDLPVLPTVPPLPLPGQQPQQEQRNRPVPVPTALPSVLDQPDPREVLPGGSRDLLRLLLGGLA
jgi:phospholipid/cholesterol/gamma-HCH transport system substrate-binding protein